MSPRGDCLPPDPSWSPSCGPSWDSSHLRLFNFPTGGASISHADPLRVGVKPCPFPTGVYHSDWAPQIWGRALSRRHIVKKQLSAPKETRFHILWNGMGRSSLTQTPAALPEGKEGASRGGRAVCAGPRPPSDQKEGPLLSLPKP